jgi:nucleotide-binding universal stress UspA family protein
VAMATHGRTGIGRLVLGSVAERVLRGVSVPVLLMRTVQSEETIETPGDQLARSLGTGEGLTIAVATDGSTHSQHALDLAATLATALGANLKMLVSVNEREGAAHAQEIMASSVNQVANLEPRPEAIPLVGYPDEEVLQYVASIPIDLLVMGALHDRGAGSSVAIGPTAQRIVQHAPVSVLMVKGRRRPIRRVLACAAVDDDVAVDVAAQLARALSAEFTLLHVVPPSAATYLSSGDSQDIDLDDVMAQGTRLSEVLKTWIGKVEKQGYDRDAIIVRKGNVPEGILEVIHDHHYDLMVVGSQSGPGHFLGSVSNAVVRFADQSVLIVRTRG